MFVAKVVGNVWASRKHPSLKNRSLLLVKPAEPETGEFIGETALAVEGGVGAGIGDTVLVLDEGGCARMILADAKAPVRTVICGVVDSLSYKGKVKKYA